MEQRREWPIVLGQIKESIIRQGDIWNSQFDNSRMIVKGV